MDLGQPSDRMLHDRLIDLVNRVNLANPLEHRQSQAATQMLAKFLKAFEYGIRCQRAIVDRQMQVQESLYCAESILAV